MTEKQIRVLMIEDSLGDARLISEMLKEVRQQTIKIEHCVRLSKGLERLSHGGIDIILLDLALPDSIGLDTLAKVRESSPDVPVICLTGREDERIGYQAVQMGAQDYLIKIQVEPNLLYRSILYAIERKNNDISLLESEARYQSALFKHKQDIQKLEAAFNCFPYAVAVISLSEGRFDRVNGIFEDITGYSDVELSGKKIEETSVMPGMRSDVLRKMTDDAKSEKKNTDAQPDQLQIRSKQGIVSHYNYHLTYLELKDTQQNAEPHAMLTLICEAAESHPKGKDTFEKEMI